MHHLATDMYVFYPLRTTKLVLRESDVWIKLSKISNTGIKSVAERGMLDTTACELS